MSSKARCSEKRNKGSDGHLEELSIEGLGGNSNLWHKCAIVLKCYLAVL